MAVVGIIALVLVGIAILIALFVAVRSVPDIRRYRRVRRL
jgi:hypothetical protein